MSKKTISKVVAVICVIAMCFTAVFTGAVSADTRSATCTITGDSYEPGAQDSYVMYSMLIVSETPFTAGSFVVAPPSGLSFVECTAATAVGGDTPNVYLNVDNNKVLFAGFSETATDDIRSYTSLTLRLWFAPETSIKASAAGTEWTIGVNTITITNTAEETYTCSDASGTAHIHNYTGTSTTTNGVKTTHCSRSGCTAVKTEIVSDTAGLATNDLADGEKNATLQFTADGDTVLVALVPTSKVNDTTYFVYKYKDDDANFKTATSTAIGTMGAYTKFPCGRNGGIGRMSRNITGNFIKVDGGTTTISADWEYSIASYAKKVADDTTKDAKDRNYCKALWNYGYYTTERLVNDSTKPQASFAPDLASYDGYTYSDVFTDDALAESSAASQPSGPFGVSKISVTTGYKPKMKITLSSSMSVTVCVYTDSENTNLVYKRTFTGSTYTLTDIPTKYLNGDIVLSANNKTFVYGFGRYAKARQTKTDKDVFKSMMCYAYYLKQAFA